jgi:sporulation protein YlmC with PRC-barrel domain
MRINENTTKHLQELGGSNFEIADGQEDIRGWDVKNAAGKRLGEVEELLFDEASQKVRYIVMDMDGNEVHLSDHKVLIPIGLAEIHEKDDDVILRSVTNEQLDALTEYDKNNLTNIAEKMVISVFAAKDLSGEENNLYQSDHFDDSKLYRNRMEGNNNKATESSDNDELIISQNQSAGMNFKSREKLF